MVHLFFPHVSILKWTASDNQIDSLLLAALGILTHRLFVKKSSTQSSQVIRFQLLLGFCALYLCLLGASYGVLDPKSLVAFVSLFVFSYLAQCFNSHREKLFHLLCVVICIAFLVGFIQKFFSSSAFGFLVRHIRTDASRGLTGLSSEPFFYGLHTLSLLFAIRIVYGFLPRSKGKDMSFLTAFVLSSISIFIFSKSSLCILLLVSYLLLEILFSKNLKWILGTFVALVFSIPIAPFLLNLFKTRRIEYLLQMLPHQGFNVFKIDLSFKSRWMDIETSLKHFYEQLPFSEGFGSGNWHGLNAYMSQNLLPSNFGWPITYKALSGFGNSIFELGWLGFLLILVYLKLIYDCKLFSTKALTISLSLILLGSVSLSTPFLGFLLGLVLWNNQSSLDPNSNAIYSSDRTVARKESNPSSKDFITSPA